jgi:hypothetical protein
MARKRCDFSFRSVRLRHQRGALYTVPFALLGAVQNQSRDWTIDKLMVGITYDSDIDRARKLIKQIGLDLAEDPEFKPLIIEPLKMQGVDALGELAVQLRMKMMTLPGENFPIRRQALAMIKKAFDANGIKFAFPTVQIAGDSEPSSAASAAVAQRPRIGQTRRGVARRKRMRTIPRNRSARLPGWTVGWYLVFARALRRSPVPAGSRCWGADSRICWAPNYRVHRGMIGTNAD